MKATIGNKHENGKNYGDKKELISTWNVVVNSAEGLKNIATVRCYMGRSASASTVYASIWVHSTDHHNSGTGKAGGYGYHKQSAAIAEAIRSAGITLDKDIYGIGDSAIEDALEAIAQALGFDDCLIVRN